MLSVVFWASVNVFASPAALIWKAAEETRVGLEAQGMGIECHKECYPGVAWPIGCFAEEVSVFDVNNGLSHTTAAVDVLLNAFYVHGRHIQQDA